MGVVFSLSGSVPCLHINHKSPVHKHHVMIDEFPITYTSGLFSHHLIVHMTNELFTTATP